jgi:hypothetical protein
LAKVGFSKQLGPILVCFWIKQDALKKDSKRANQLKSSVIQIFKSGNDFGFAPYSPSHKKGVL